MADTERPPPAPIHFDPEDARPFPRPMFWRLEEDRPDDRYLIPHDTEEEDFAAVGAGQLFLEHVRAVVHERKTDGGTVFDGDTHEAVITFVREDGTTFERTADVSFAVEITSSIEWSEEPPDSESTWLEGYTDAAHEPDTSSAVEGVGLWDRCMAAARDAVGKLAAEGIDLTAALIGAGEEGAIALERFAGVLEGPIDEATKEVLRTFAGNMRDHVPPVHSVRPYVHIRRTDGQPSAEQSAKLAEEIAAAGGDWRAVLAGQLAPDEVVKVPDTEPAPPGSSRGTP